MPRHLVVTQPFGAHQRGDKIEDAALVAEIEAGPNAAHVVAVSVDEVKAKPAKKTDAAD